MTCIVGLIKNGSIWMAADSMGTRGNESTIMQIPKVFRNGSFLFAHTGEPRHAQLLMSEAFSPPKINDKQTAIDYLVLDVVKHIRELFRAHGAIQVLDACRETCGSEFLLGFAGGLYLLEGNFQITQRTDPFNASGCGGQYALGALHALAQNKISPRKKLEEALRAAERFDPYVAGPFKILSMKVAK